MEHMSTKLLIQTLGSPDWKVNFVIWQLTDSRPHLVGGSLEDTENAEQLIDFRVALE